MGFHTGFCPLPATVICLGNTKILWEWSTRMVFWYLIMQRSYKRNKNNISDRFLLTNSALHKKSLGENDTCCRKTSKHRWAFHSRFWKIYLQFYSFKVNGSSTDGFTALRNAHLLIWHFCSTLSVIANFTQLQISASLLVHWQLRIVHTSVSPDVYLAC